MFTSIEIKDLQIINRFPKKVIQQENVWIPLSDGTRLAARIWMPNDAEKNPLPAVFEYIPYRKRDATVSDDEMIHPYFAGNGYVCLRIDLRGSGDSEGYLVDEYTTKEQDDALEVIDWLCNQQWCDGNIGMIGISWGGFAALQVAARQPAALKAIITVGSTVDRYNDDIHYKCGCLLSENVGWAATMLSFCSRPPDPAVIGNAWRDIWLNRLERQPYLIEPWFTHQHRDDYWKHGSVCENYDAIKAAVLAIGGWADAYVNAVPNLMENLKAHCRGIIGPWPHRYPHLAAPGPAIGFLQECIRWWDQWLKSVDTGVMKEPLCRAFCQIGSQPDPHAKVKAGYWISEESWPSTNISYQKLYFNSCGLSKEEEESSTCKIHSPEDLGQAGGELVPHCSGAEMPQEQSIDDERSLVFDSLPLEEGLEIFGAPEANIYLSIDKPQGNLIVRLCDVNPEGLSERISYGVLNLCHRNSNESPAPVTSGEPFYAAVRLNHIAHRFLRGSRIRIAISTAYWPIIWPSPETVTMTFYYGTSNLIMPVRRNTDQRIPKFEQPVSPPPAKLKELRAPSSKRVVCKDQTSGRSSIEIIDYYGKYENLEHGLINGGIAREYYSIHEEDPESATTSKEWTQVFQRKAWSVRTETSSQMTCDKDSFHFVGYVKAYESDKLIHEKKWHKSIPRSCV